MADRRTNPTHRRSAVPSLPDQSAELSTIDASALSTVIVRAAPGTTLMKTLSAISPGRVVTRRSVLIVPVQVGEWWYLGGATDVAVAIGELDLAEGTSVVDITHARSIVRISGVEAGSSLQNLTDLDLSDAAFPNGSVANTSVAGERCQLIRDDIARTDRTERSYLFGFERSLAAWMVERLAR